MKFSLLLSVAVAVAAMQAQSFSAVVVQDDFDSYTVGATLPWQSKTVPVVNGESNAKTVIEQDTANAFGKGTSNQYALLQVHYPSGGGYVNLNATRIVSGAGFGQTGQIAFDFYQPSSVDNSGYGFLFRIGGATAYNSNEGTAFAILFRNGSLYATTSGLSTGSLLGSYGKDQVNNLVIVFNNTSASEAYAGNSGLQAQSMDLWLNGTLLASNVAHSGGLVGDTALTWLNFTNLGQASDATLYLDNVAVNNAASVPEPKVLGLLLLGAAALPFLRRRNRRRA